MPEPVVNVAPHVLDTWRRIAEHTSERAGFTISTDTIARYAKRAVDPLPTRRWGGKHPRVVAGVVELDAWIDRQWTRP